MSEGRRNPEAVIDELRSIVDRLQDQEPWTSLSQRQRRAVESGIRHTLTDLSQILTDLDPIQQPVSMFDPGDPKIVGRFVSLALVAQPRRSLANIGRFYGSGVYAIYYTGDFPAYRVISGTETPIYVGQASPAINNARTPTEQGDRLCRRLNDHRKNIIRAQGTLDIQDFNFRVLVVQSGWETAAEDYLIHLFHPIWNNETGILYGLGKHGDSATTRSNKRSPWDTLHPGRPWASDVRLVDAKSAVKVSEELSTHFSSHPPFPDIEAVLTSFFDELSQV